MSKPNTKDSINKLCAIQTYVSLTYLLKVEAFNILTE